MSEEPKYALIKDAPYAVELGQRVATGTLPTGTVSTLIGDSDMGGQIRTADGIEGWVAWDALKLLTV